MHQRNDTGTARIFPTLTPPLEVADGETIDHPERLDLLTPVGPRGRVLDEDEAAEAEQAESKPDKAADAPEEKAAESTEPVKPKRGRAGN